MRNPEGARKTIEGSFDKSITDGKICYEKCDTGDMESVRDFALKVQEKFSAIHVLINNGEVITRWCFKYFSQIIILSFQLV